MKIIPVKWDSFSVRSTCTLVKIKNKKILIDPGTAVGPSRYGLPPSPLEMKELSRGIKEISSLAKEVDIITISHYHYDHYFPEGDFYTGKELFIKNPENKINKSQRKRATDFIEHLKKIKAEYNISDNNSYKKVGINIHFSPPLFHGAENSKLGYVIAIAVKEGKNCFIHASDVQGPQTKETTDWIIEQNPDILFLSGFPTLFLGWRFPKKNLEKSNQNLTKILNETKIKTIVLDHHLVRDLNYKNKIQSVLIEANKLNKKVITAAEFLGIDNKFIEARRKELFLKR